MKQQKPWLKFRHRVITALARPVLGLTASLKYHIKIDRFAGQGKQNWLILANHQTDFDQFFVGLAFRGPLYYVALEDLFSNGWVSDLITWAVAPIPFMKASADVRAVMNCIRIAREGGSIVLFPEGNRTYSGRTCYIKPSVAALAKKLGLPIALFRIEGGYGVKPRWADSTRNGRMHAGVHRVIEPEEYQDMSKEELYSLICRELWVDETESGGLYPCRRAAEGLERVLYLCPDCGPSEFESAGDTVSCRRCGRAYRYRPDKRLEALEGETPFRHVADWYDYQETAVRSMDLSPYVQTPLFRDTADLSEVIVYKKKQLIRKKIPICIYGDRVELGSGEDAMVLDYSVITAMGCIEGHKLNIFSGGRIFQLKGGKGFNALKYCNIFYHAKFMKETHADGEFQFLGL